MGNYTLSSIIVQALSSNSHIDGCRCGGAARTLCRGSISKRRMISGSWKLICAREFDVQRHHHTRFVLFDNGVCAVCTEGSTLHRLCCRLAKTRRSGGLSGTRRVRRWLVASVWRVDGRAEAADSELPYLGGGSPVGIYPR
jgi:hypothetical protein